MKNTIKYKLVKFLVIIALALSAIVLIGGSATEDIVPTFPLAKGSYWVYQGTTKWTKEQSVHEENITWKMEVVEAIQRGHVTGFVLKGSPYDLAWYNEGKEPGNYVMIHINPDQFYLVSNNEKVAKVVQRLKDKDDALVGLVEEHELFLDFPLSRGKVFGDAQQITRKDRWYCWLVESEKARKLENIKGIEKIENVTEYELAYRTSPEYTIMDIVPGVGITRFVYVHHGSIAETDVKLIEYFPGKEIG
ncbi:MAG TPA: hypothetical protein DEG17_24400 [Cyanobacteria bacterium UBA11149]|nr:hypothetical protein [Cyanobacteria bacterium UBA11367]HBE60373.1 hypothetical protein [Cyanobacteria bacterium UBA11366]HBK62665.1 hypothetical protein [Cyanobacteria bacterium UBA11166]HBR73235.1 hypothetical protein [Cyanobacteria bacterium UBA11159]HBS70144.1 hypothetical protein [Cyanobacteria bacterium UBA11153]HBW91920.1 hypothetical protein [Cyanobacteria bacterium UBA11149]HCA96706.1 hypothetical protein [Cyanobacteria bacterium UBA9226]